MSVYGEQLNCLMEDEASMQSRSLLFRENKYV